jgi:hypothetical protein
MRRYLRSDVTLLSPEAYSDIINAKGKKNISPVLAKKNTKYHYGECIKYGEDRSILLVLA